MAKPYFELYNECKSQIFYFTLAKNLLIKSGLVLTAVSLIVFGINLINENQNKALFTASAVSVFLTVACFLALFPINQKIKDLRSQRKYRSKNILVNS